jgi:uncharacterized LabA/DUF88 family protein
MERSKKKKERNIAFIDGQNLYMGTTLLKDKPWKIDLKKLRIFLKDKYKIKTAYYFLGYIQECNQDLYNSIQEAGFVLSFRKHNSAMLGKKKGNVDTDIVFLAMKKVYKKDNFDKIVLVSGDGDYLRLVDFLIEEKKFKKLLSPNKKFMSSLYKKLGSEYFDFLDKKNIKKKIKTKINKSKKK